MLPEVRPGFPIPPGVDHSMCEVCSIIHEAKERLGLSGLDNPGHSITIEDPASLTHTPEWRNWQTR